MYVEVDVILHAIGKPYGSEKFWSLKKSLILLWGIKCPTISRFNTVANILQYIVLTLFGTVEDTCISFMFIGLFTGSEGGPYDSATSLSFQLQKFEYWAFHMRYRLLLY